VARGHQQAHPRRRLWQRPAHTVVAVRELPGARARVAARQVLVHRTRAGRAGIVLGVAAERGRTLDRAPVVEHLGHVVDARRIEPFAAAQDQVVVLAALEAWTEAAHGAHPRGADHAQVADVVL